MAHPVYNNLPIGTVVRSVSAADQKWAEGKTVTDPEMLPSTRRWFVYVKYPWARRPYMLFLDQLVVAPFPPEPRKGIWRRFFGL